jgi:hypothetical protein
VIAATVYVLCAATTLTCTILLLRANRRQPNALLFWSALCFVGLTLSNILLFIDLVVVPMHDLSTIRGAVTLLSLSSLIYSLIWNTK